jgi:predicted nucleic acid-binding protein
MEHRIVISDASPLIALLDIGSEHLLYDLYGEVLITDVVRWEIHQELPSWVKETTEYDQETYRNLIGRLDPGEASAIALTMKYPGSLLIVDERRGRKIARQYGLSIIGVLGIILRAKRENLIPSGRDLLDRLSHHGFFLAEDLRNDLLKLLGE